MAHEKLHNSEHESGGADEISVAGLTGVLATTQNPTNHAIGAGVHDASSLLELNGKVTDATLVDGGGTGTPTFASVTVDSDTNGVTLGDGQDTSLIYDGSDCVLTTDLVAASDFVVDCGTQKTMKLSEPVYRDWNFSVLSLAGGPGDPDIIDLASTDIEVAAFNGGSSTEEVSGVIELNHEYKEGTDIVPHIHWYPTTTGTGNVVWQLEYTILGSGDTAGTSTTITVTDAASGTAWLQELAAWSAISGTGLTIGDQLHFRLFRDPTDGGDTYGADAAAATFGFHYQIDTMGSRQIATK